MLFVGVTEVLGFFACTLALCSFIYNWTKSRNFPPGPIGLPLLGYLPFLGTEPHDTLWKLSKKYGDIFSCYIGRRLVICVTDYQMIKEILGNPLSLGRPEGFDSDKSTFGFGGMNGEEWYEQRRFSMVTMKKIGMGKGLWETLLQENASYLVKEIKKMNCKPFPWDDILAISHTKQTLSLMLGRHLDAENEKSAIQFALSFRKMLHEQTSVVGVAASHPSVLKLAELFNLSGYRDFIRCIRKFKAIFKNEVNKRVESNEKHTTDDFIGCYLQEMELRNKSNKPHTFTLESLCGNLILLIIGVLDGTMTSVSWLLLLMANYPTVQKKIAEEIDQAIGRNGVVSYDDRVKLPYTTATVYEMLRYIAINPLLTTRNVLGDFEFGGYTIPAGSHIVGNSWAMSHDPRYHPNPMEFQPERFLNEDETKVKMTTNYGFFSFGKRNCPAETVAMINMHVYFVSIMQKYTIKTPHGGPPDMEYKYAGGSVAPKPQNLCFIER